VLEILGKMRFYVSLPASTKFRACRAGITDSKLELFDTPKLDGAVVHPDGRTALTDRQELTRVEIIPAIRSLIPSELDYIIIHCLIAHNGAQSWCYRDLADHLPEFWRAEKPPDLRHIDWSRVPDLTSPPLKVLVGYIQKRFPDLTLSEQKVSDTLRISGVRIPIPRPRKAKITVLP
jgi:hypothetical protein